VAEDVGNSGSSVSGDGGDGVSVRNLYLSLTDATNGTTTSGVVFHSYLCPYRQYLSALELSLQSLLLPAPPLHSWYTPPRECNVPRERADYNTTTSTTPYTTTSHTTTVTNTAVSSSSTSSSVPYTNSNTSHINTIITPVIFAPADELLIAEHFLAHISVSVGTKSIRLTNTAGTYLLMCVGVCSI